MNAKSSAPQGFNFFEHTDIQPLIAWLSCAFADLQAQTQAMVDDYWRRLDDGQKGRKGLDRATLGLRIRARENGSFSIEWYRMGHLRRSRRDVTADYIRKGFGYRYSEASLLRNQPQWLHPIVRELEDSLSVCRQRNALLGKMRLSVVHYQRSIQPNPLSRSKLYRAVSES